MNLNRRQFLVAGTAISAALATSWARAQEIASPTPASSPASTEPGRPARQDLELVKQFVVAGHTNLPRVKELLAQDPKLVLAAWDWGKGDWETALGGAAHLGNRELARYLLAHGARIDSFAAAMLGERAVMLALLAANPTTATIKGPHGYTLLYHVAIGGDVTVAEAMKPLLPEGTKDYNQALTAAARDGHLPMTKWLLENGVTDPNVPDGMGKTALFTAVKKGFHDVADELRRHGGRDAVSME
jgi:hypothetical protein